MAGDGSSRLGVTGVLFVVTGGWSLTIGVVVSGWVLSDWGLVLSTGVGFLVSGIGLGPGWVLSTGVGFL